MIGCKITTWMFACLHVKCSNLCSYVHKSYFGYLMVWVVCVRQSSVCMQKIGNNCLVVCMEFLCSIVRELSSNVHEN